jgi:hypothetical protein
MSNVRYESSLGPDLPVPIVSYDPMSLALLKKCGNLTDISDYIIMFVKHPLEMLGIYTSHLVNLLDPRYGNLYFSDAIWTPMHMIRAWLSFTLWFFGFMGVIVLLGEQRVIKSNSRMVCLTEFQNLFIFIKKYGIVILYFGFSALAGMVVHGEPRYLVAGYILLFLFFGYFYPFKRIFSIFKIHPISIIFIYIMALGCCNAIWNWTFGATGLLDKMVK